MIGDKYVEYLLVVMLFEELDVPHREVLFC